LDPDRTVKEIVVEGVRETMDLLDELTGSMKNSPSR